MKWGLEAMSGVMFRNSIVLSAMLLAGCMSQSSIQSKYTTQQNECRDQVARAAAASNTSLATQEGQASIGVHFSDCMNRAGWRVAVPRSSQPPTNVAQYPPSGAPSTNPSATAAATPQPGWYMKGPESPTGVMPNSPTGAPSVAPSAALGAAPVSAPQPMMAPQPTMMPAPQPTAPARYQPARPTMQVPAYGQGGGRRF